MKVRLPRSCPYLQNDPAVPGNIPRVSKKETSVDVGESLTRWTVRFALGCYVLGVALPLWSRSSLRTQAQARWAWTLGCLAFLAHVLCAFQFFHHWSYAAAYEETARQTAERFGLAWGGGLYFNYAFTAAWVTDVFWWWRGLKRYQARPRWLGIALHGFFGFMAFNATVVFATGLVRWLGLSISLGLAVLWWRAQQTTIGRPD